MLICIDAKHGVACMIEISFDPLIPLIPTLTLAPHHKPLIRERICVNRRWGKKWTVFLRTR